MLMSDEQKLDRREFFKRAGILGAAVAGGAQLLAACDKGGGGGGGGQAPSEQGSGGSGSKEGGGKAGGSDKGGELSCTDTSGLSDQEKKTRESLNYVDHTEKEGKRCDNCRLYEPPENEGECAGCQVVPGPIHPDGYCTSWQKKKS